MHRSDCKSVCYDDVLLELQSNKGLLSQAKNQHHDSNTNCTASGAVSSNLLSRPTFETLAVFAIHKGGGSLSLHPNKTILRSCRDESPLQTSLQLPPSAVVDVGSLPQHDTLGSTQQNHQPKSLPFFCVTGNTRNAPMPNCAGRNTFDKQYTLLSLRGFVQSLA